MKTRMNPKWIAMVEEKHRKGESIDLTIPENMVAQWLVVFLSNHNVPFKITNLGAGVKRITTITNCCPMCGRNINKEE
jgi:hypothetical protein